MYTPHFDKGGISQVYEQDSKFQCVKLLYDLSMICSIWLYKCNFTSEQHAILKGTRTFFWNAWFIVVAILTLITMFEV